MGKAYATRASRAANKKEALALQEEGFARLQAVFSRGSYAGAAGICDQLVCGCALLPAHGKLGLIMQGCCTWQGCPALLTCFRLILAVDELKDVAKSLRRLPVVEPELPTVRYLSVGSVPLRISSLLLCA